MMPPHDTPTTISKSFLQSAFLFAAPFGWVRLPKQSQQAKAQSFCAFPAERPYSVLSQHCCPYLAFIRFDGCPDPHTLLERSSLQHSDAIPAAAGPEGQACTQEQHPQDAHTLTVQGLARKHVSEPVIQPSHMLRVPVLLETSIGQETGSHCIASKSARTAAVMR
jgi:hypothetical protein